MTVLFFSCKHYPSELLQVFCRLCQSGMKYPWIFWPSILSNSVLLAHLPPMLPFCRTTFLFETYVKWSSFQYFSHISLSSSISKTRGSMSEQATACINQLAPRYEKYAFTQQFSSLSWPVSHISLNFSWSTPQLAATLIAFGKPASSRRPLYPCFISEWAARLIWVVMDGSAQLNSRQSIDDSIRQKEAYNAISSIQYLCAHKEQPKSPQWTHFFFIRNKYNVN